MRLNRGRAVRRFPVRATALPLHVMMLCFFACAASIAQDTDGGESRRFSGPNTDFTFSLPGGWHCMAQYAVADMPNAARMLGMFALTQIGRNTDNLSLWWDGASEEAASGPASLHRYAHEGELTATGVLAWMQQSGSLPESMELRVCMAGEYDAVLGGGHLESGLYGAVVAIPGDAALYVLTVLGPYGEVSPRWTTIIELAGSIRAPDAGRAARARGEPTFWTSGASAYWPGRTTFLRTTVALVIFIVVSLGIGGIAPLTGRYLHFWAFVILASAAWMLWWGLPQGWWWALAVSYVLLGAGISLALKQPSGVKWCPACGSPIILSREFVEIAATVDGNIMFDAVCPSCGSEVLFTGL